MQPRHTKTIAARIGAAIVFGGGRGGRGKGRGGLLDGCEEDIVEKEAVFEAGSVDGHLAIADENQAGACGDPGEAYALQGRWLLEGVIEHVVDAVGGGLNIGACGEG